MHILWSFIIHFRWREIRACSFPFCFYIIMLTIFFKHEFFQEKMWSRLQEESCLKLKNDTPEIVKLFKEIHCSCLNPCHFSLYFYVFFLLVFFPPTSSVQQAKLLNFESVNKIILILTHWPRWLTKTLSYQNSKVLSEVLATLKMPH